MSLVAYAASSDDSDYEDDQATIEAKVVLPKKPTPTVPTTSGNISDDEDYIPIDASLPEKKLGAFMLILPKPKQLASAENSIREEIEKLVTPAFSKLPMPKNKTYADTRYILEEEDEFLRKKVSPVYKNDQEKPNPVAKGPVKIIIPALKDFKDVEKEMADKVMNKNVSTGQTKGCGLLSLLPQAKSEQNFAKYPTTVTGFAPRSNNSTNPMQLAFIPDTVKNRRPAHNTEGIDGKKAHSTNVQKVVVKPNIALVDCSGSEASDEEDDGDFFSLNTSENLPEVSANEINAMVAKRAAKMAATTMNYLSAEAVEETMVTEQAQPCEENVQHAQKRYHEQLNAEAVQALVGSSAKRRRNQQQGVQVMDISSDQILPSQGEWMRTALASSTAYQPTGVLVDEEPVAGTRRKHQITYLAHKAKANEAELQAMWAANRQNRRATQSKYGF